MISYGSWYMKYFRVLVNITHVVLSSDETTYVLWDAKMLRMLNFLDLDGYQPDFHVFLGFQGSLIIMHCPFYVT